MSKNIIIIGGGVAGLVAGIKLQQLGYQTTIFEKHSVAGGNLTGWYRQKLYIDNCMHWLNGSKKDFSSYNDWLSIGALEEKTLLRQGSCFYQSSFNGKTIGLYQDLQRTQSELTQFAPRDSKHINKFLKAVKYCVSLLDETKSKMHHIFSLLRLLCCYGRKTIEEATSKYLSSELKTFFGDYIPKNLSIYILIFAYASFVCGDGKVPADGSLAMAKRIINTYQKTGGKLKTSLAVARIVHDRSHVCGIELANGERYSADAIICACDPIITFTQLLDVNLAPMSIKRLYADQDFPVVSSFHLAYSVPKTKRLPISDTMIINCEPIKLGKTFIDRVMLRNYRYLTAYKGKDKYVLQVFIFQDEKDYAFWQGLTQAQYQKHKQRIAAHFATAICEHFSLDREELTFLDCWTPATYTKYFGSYKGSYMSFLITKKLAFNYLKTRPTKLENLFIASSWQHLFGGLPNAYAAGARCSKAVDKYFNI